VSAVGSRCFIDVGAEKNFFDTKNGAEKVPKVIEIVAKGNPNEARNLERHPYGTVSNKYGKKDAKRERASIIF
jgi:hypothetical protein